jgi:hypothetical protein
MPSSATSQEPEWRVSATPTISIGGETGTPGGPIFGVRGLARLSDGRIVVADQAQRLLLFDAEGNYVRTIGRRGNGPGEFEGITGIQLLRNDTMLVADSRNGRIAYLTADEGLKRSVTIPGDDIPWIVGALSDGTLVGRRTSDRGDFGPQSDRVGWAGVRQEVFRSDAAGRIVNTFGTFPEPGILIIPIGGGSRIPVVMGGPSSPLPQTLIALAGRQIYVATGERFEIMVYQPNSANPTIIRRDDYEPRPLREGDLVEFFSELQEFNSRVNVDWNRVPWDIPRGFIVSAISSLLVVEQGNVWAEEGPWVSGRSRAWSVFTPSGRHLARTIMPPRFRPFEIRTESVLGVWRDGLDVEHVQVRALNRTP